MLTISAKEVELSRFQALEKIKSLLGSDDIEGQFEGRRGNYYSKDKFIVTWSGNHHGMACEYKIEKCDNIYKAMSGYVCIYGHAGLCHEKQLEGFHSFERALVTVGLKLCANRKAKEAFYNQYAVPYNNRIKEAAQDD